MRGRDHTEDSKSVRADGSECASPRLPINPKQWAAISNALQLSPRESQIANQLLMNRSESEIATTLGISSHTVHSHVERLYRKLVVRSRAELLLRLFSAYVTVVGDSAGDRTQN
jgi:DNA-binding CsgD family transcriptional regulator